MEQACASSSLSSEISDMVSGVIPTLWASIRVRVMVRVPSIGVFMVRFWVMDNGLVSGLGID